MHFTIELRQAAVRCKLDALASNLRHIAQDLEDALLKLRLNPTADNMARVNGLWALGHRLKQSADKDAAFWGKKDAS